MDEETVAAVVIVALTVALGGAGISLSRRPDRWRSVLTERFWLRWARWTIILTAAAIIGVAAGGGTLLLQVIATGMASLVFAAAMWTTRGGRAGRGSDRRRVTRCVL